MYSRVLWTIISIPNNYWRRYVLRHALEKTKHIGVTHCFLVNPSSYTVIEHKMHADICLSKQYRNGYDTVVKTLEQMQRVRTAYEYYIFSDDDAFVDIKSLRDDLHLIGRTILHTKFVYGAIEWSSIGVKTGLMNGWGYSPSSALRAKRNNPSNSLAGPFPFMKGPCFVIGKDALRDITYLAPRALETLEQRRHLLVDIFLGYVMMRVRSIHVIDMGKDLVEARFKRKLCDKCRVLHMNSRHSTRIAAHQNQTMYALFSATAQRTLKIASKTALYCETPPYWHHTWYIDKFLDFSLPLGRNWTWCGLR